MLQMIYHLAATESPRSAQSLIDLCNSVTSGESMNEGHGTCSGQYLGLSNDEDHILVGVRKMMVPARSNVAVDAKSDNWVAK